jgi:tetratricopeptide (TPR) repeat protein
MLETAPADPHTEYHLGIAQWHAGDRAQAVRSWERALPLAPSSWALLRCLAVADREGGHTERAAERYADAFDDLCRARGDGGPEWTAATAALGREAIETLLAAGRTGTARAVWERLDPATRQRGRFRLLQAALLLAEGRPQEARAVFDAGFEVADLREGDEVIGRLWARLSDEPLPDRYDFRMRPS